MKVKEERTGSRDNTCRINEIQRQKINKRAIKKEREWVTE